jgi:hypothetical protein
VIALPNLGLELAHKGSRIQEKAVSRGTDRSFNFDISSRGNSQRDVSVPHFLVSLPRQRKG